jgi:sugar/nucleoside kinase (ribokinase family)
MEGILFIGHCTKDVITIGENTSYIPGGGVYFGAVSAGYCLKANNKDAKETSLEVLTIGNKEDYKQIDQEIKNCGGKLILIEDKSTTTFKHWFRDNQPDKRESSVPAIARSFTWDDIKDYKAKIFYVNPLLFGEMPLDLFQKMKGNCELISCDAQGLLRQYKSGELKLQVPEGLGEALKYIDILKVDCVEAEVLTGIKDSREACLKLLEQGPKFVIYTQSEAVELHTKETCYKSAFTQWSLEGRTGRGDTVSAAFLLVHFILGRDIQESLDIAAKATGKKMMHPGAARKEDFE